MAPSNTFQIRITGSFDGNWYQGMVGQTLTAKHAQNVKVKGRACRLSFFEVVGGKHDGDYVHLGHAAITSSVSQFDLLAQLLRASN